MGWGPGVVSEDVCWIPGLAQWVAGLVLAVAGMWASVAALIRPLARERPHATGVA